MGKSLGTKSNENGQISGEKVDLGKLDIIEIKGELFEAKRLVKVGGSFAFLVPKLWLEMFCKEQDGSYLVAYRVGDSIIEIIGTQEPYRRQGK